MNQQFQYWVLASRPKTLTISVSAIILGTVLAYPQFDFISFITCFLIAICLQIAVNLANDYSDGKSGVDTKQRLGPTRVVAAGLLPAKKVKSAYIALLVITAVLAVILSIHVSYFYLFILIISILATLAYSAGPFSIASNGLGELFAFLFFGVIAITCTYYAQTKTINLSILLFSCVIGCYSTATMLVNNIRDIDSDKQAGKLTLAAKIGRKKSKHLYVFLLIGSLVFHFFASASLELVKYIPIIICSIPICLLIKDIFRQSGHKLNALLAKTAALSILYTLSTAVCWIYAS